MFSSDFSFGPTPSGDEQVFPLPKASNDVTQSFMSMTEEDLKKKNEITNVWEKQVRVKTRGIRNPNMTPEQLLTLVEKNTSSYQQCLNGKWSDGCSLTWLQTNVAVLPAHAVPKTTVKWRIMDNGSVSSAMNVVVNPHQFHASQNGDIAFLHLAGRPKKSIVPYLDFDPTDLIGWRLRRSCTDGAFFAHDVKGAPVTNLAGHKVIQWQGDVESNLGDCGGAYIRRGKNPSIVGFHYSAMKVDHKKHRSCIFTAAEFDEFLIRTHNSASRMVTAAEPDSWDVKIGDRLIVDTHDSSKIVQGVAEQAKWLYENTEAGRELEERRSEPVESAPVDVPLFDINNFEDNQGYQEIGSCPLGARFDSKVIPTIIAGQVAMRFPALEFAGPPFGRSMWPKSAMYSIHGALGLPADHLEWAAQDYLSGFARTPDVLAEHLRPLTWDETLNGIDGVRFIDSMNWSTSMGPGLRGNKAAWATEWFDENGNVRRDMIPVIWEYVKQAEMTLAEAVRIGFLFNATPKDEPTPADKDKVRLFMVASIVCTLLVRKYFTPVCRLLQMTTVVSECAVGFNCTSEDWDSMMKHLERYQLAFDGDHSKYDLMKPAQLSMASYKILILLAAMGDYTADDLYTMQMLTSELLVPLVSFAGSVYLLDGSTPSGIPVTVIVNGLDNSLMNRCAYKSLFPQARVGEFRRYVSHVNYGDDFINTVSWWRSSFNFLSVKEYLGKYGMKITPGIKTAQGKRFVPLEDLVFLQRHSVKLPELDFRVGALKEESIIKPLLAVVKGSLDPATAAAVNIDGALREFVYHGEEIYEDRRKWLTKIAIDHGITHLCTVLDKPYLDLLLSLQ